MELVRCTPPQHLRPRAAANDVFTNRTIKRKPLFATAVMTKPSAVETTSLKKTTVVVRTPLRIPQQDQPLLRVSPESLQYEEGKVGAEPDHLVTDGPLSSMEYLTRTLTSKVYDVALQSPLQLAGKLSAKLGVNIWLKREDLQPVFSFKLRGAYNMMAKLPKEQLERGVICSSAGNHAQGVAVAAQRLGCDAVIAMPVTTPEINKLIFVGS